MSNDDISRSDQARSELETRDEETVDPVRAASFARLVDGLLDGEAIPPALDASDRSLLESATLIMSSNLGALSQDALLEPERSKWIVDRALEDALLGASQAHSSKLATLDLETLEGTEALAASGEAIPEEIEPERTDVIRLSARRADRVLRALPWVVASVAVAAAIVLFVTRPSSEGSNESETTTAAVAPHHVSRPTDRLVGEITAAAAGNASARLDAIYSDRLASFREIKYSEIKLTGAAGLRPGKQEGQ